MSIWEKFGDIGRGVGSIIGGDWGGFQDIYSGVKGLFEGAEASRSLQERVLGGYGQGYGKPNVSLMRYKDDASPVGSAGRIAALGDTDNIPKWSRNQAVAMYYLNSINKITQQGSDRKGA